MRRFLALVAASTIVVACGGGQSSTAPTQAAAASVAATAAPTTGATLTNPPPTQIPGCLPQCWLGHLKRPGPLAGDYTTSYFFGGQMTVTLPVGWYGFEDSTGELSLGQKDRSDFGLVFALDLYAVADAQGTPDERFERSAEGVTTFFVQQQGIDIIKRGAGTIGKLPGEAIEYRRSDDATNQDPDCPEEIRPCIVELGYPEWDTAFGEGSPFHSRIVIAKATWGGQEHAVYAILWAEEGSYDEVAETAIAIINGAQLPDGVEAPPLASP